MADEPPASAGDVTSFLEPIPVTMVTAVANATTNDTSGDYKPNVADAAFDKDTRVLVLLLEMIIGFIGGILVCLWLWFNRRRKSRVNMLILNVVVSDLLVIIGACLIQFIWEMVDRHWVAGNVMCKLVKFFQSYVMMGSSNMLVVLSIDRHQAIRSPLREPWPVWKMTSLGWVLAAVLSLPMLHVFSATEVVDPKSQFFNMTVCESIFRKRPLIDRQAFLTFISIMHFYLPCLIILVCYVRIFRKVSQKADEYTTGKTHLKPGKIQLQSTGSSSLPKAKIKTLKMAIIIVVAFAICGLPYHIVELIFNFWPDTVVPSSVYAILAGVAVANSAVNPYVFLGFNVSSQCLRATLKNRKRRVPYDTKAEYSGNSSHGGETTRTMLKYTGPYGPDVVEMGHVRGGGAGMKGAKHGHVAEGGGRGGGGGCGGAGGAGGGAGHAAKTGAASKPKGNPYMLVNTVEEEKASSGGGTAGGGATGSGVATQNNVKSDDHAGCF